MQDTNNGQPRLDRALTLTQATAINMIDMVGIGPFITISFVVGLMQGPVCILAWVLGALLAYMDGLVWAEMGAKWPEAGGSYVFLQRLFGGRLGKLMAFLFIWQTTIQAPLVVASGAIGFSGYLEYLIPLGFYGKKIVSGALVILLVALLYRDIKSIGKISVLLWIITGGTILWLIFSAYGQFNAAQAFDWHLDSNMLSAAFFVALGQASLKSVYSYLGYYNVCHLGAEIKQPERNIPRAIFISITGIAILYISMQIAVLGVLPWQEIAASEFVVSTYFERIYNHTAGQVATVLILCIALASLFSVILGYSRIPYAAAKNGDFFKVFARVHPRLHFPHISLLALGGLAFVFSLLFKMKEVITAIISMRILIQFVSQAVGVIAWHYSRPKDERPFRMLLFPIPAIISIIIWLFILFTSEWQYILFAIGIIVIGIILFKIKERFSEA
ncbi:APC family permease [Polluticoccus soli]|uniref:APC family permease n=1 Tax=Polluticoccus soli TaxID=3034150 RepID=UPI0023E1B119|nr:APC family permease [Flavipsychrobacter sp. JY13-12]